MTRSENRLVVPKNLPEPARQLVQLVAGHLKRNLTRARRQITAGLVSVNLELVRRPHQILKPGDVIQIFPEEKPIKLPQPKSLRFPHKLQVIYEDSQLLVVDKPAGLLAVPAHRGDRKTLLQLAENYLDATAETSEVFCLQRLDRDVSGVVVFAKDQASYDHLRQQFQNNKPKRKYVAIVAGVLQADSGTFRSYLATGKHLKRYSVKNPKHGELAITHYRVLRRLTRETVVEVELETGRRNQIRVHFAEAGHPVIGETRYQRLKATRESWNGQRIALHANTLAIIQPQSGEKLEFCSPWPAEFKKFLQSEKGGTNSGAPAATPTHSPATPPQSATEKGRSRHTLTGGEGPATREAVAPSEVWSRPRPSTKKQNRGKNKTESSDSHPPGQKHSDQTDRPRRANPGNETRLGRVGSGRPKGPRSRKKKS